ncbi:MAG: DUF1189 domain-containing protein [Lachnospiraceae bacterium]|nr:DUF1189 domain-containing protein [Butyrivibrio sp.]MCM1344122.1 DUF1189 domain-containing protein [Muribaculaceae bacterium]MCM1411915.1 DUF1189 domain-containing protein [Lachnospiraceae bacterium]
MDNNFNQQTNANPNPYMDNGYGGYGSSYNYGSSQEPEKAPNIFRQFVLAFIPPQYDRLTKVKTGSMIGFVTLLALVATIISFVGFMFSFAALNSSDWEDVLPDFEIADGRLYIDEDFVFDQSGTFVYMTDDISGFSYEEASAIASEGYRNMILMGSERISVYQNGEYQQARFSDLGSDIEISRDWIVEVFMPIMMVVFAVGYLLFFVGRVFWYFLCAAIYLLIGMIIASCMKKQVSAGALFRVAVYSKVLMFVVATVLALFPVAFLSVPFILRIAITIIFMGVAIAKLPEKNESF